MEWFDEKVAADQDLKKEMERQKSLEKLKNKFIQSGTYDVVVELNPWFDLTIKPTLTQDELAIIIDRAIANRDLNLFRHFNVIGANGVETTKQEVRQKALLTWLLSLTTLDEIEALLVLILDPYVIHHALNHYQAQDYQDRFNLCVRLHNAPPYGHKYFTLDHLQYALDNRDFDIASLIRNSYHFRITCEFERRFDMFADASVQKWLDENGYYITCSIC